MAWADGWLPHIERGGDGPLLQRLAEVRRGARPGFELGLAMAPPDSKRLAEFVAVGVTRFVFQLPTATCERAEADIDRAMSALWSLG
jgi:hypothetical protein